MTIADNAPFGRPAQGRLIFNTGCAAAIKRKNYKEKHFEYTAENT